MRSAHPAPRRLLSLVGLLAALASAAAPTAAPIEASSRCGLPPVESDLDRVRGLVRDAGRHFATSDGIDKPYRVVCRFNVVRSADGDSPFDPARIDDMMRDLNVGFRNTPFVFVREPGVRFIDNDAWHAGFPSFSSMIPMLNQHYEPGVLSWYIVSSVLDGAAPASTWYGPPNTSGQRGILMDQSLLGQPTNIVTPTHEVGHIFGLWHPFETVFGIECTSGSNCATAGDLLCDTPASPLLFGANTTATGIYYGDEPGPCSDDPPYDPDPTLYMGAGWPAGHILRDSFTPDQRSVMETVLHRDQPDLVGPLAPEIVVDCDGDGVDDADAILEGRVSDRNRDIVPDVCQPTPASGDLVVAGMTQSLGNRPRVFDPDTGEQRTELWNGLPWTHQLRRGPDGLVYMPNLSMVARLDLATGRTRDIVVDGRLDGASVFVDVAFDGARGLLALDNVDATIRRYDRITGELTGVFADLSTVGMSSPKAMIRGPDDSLLVVGNGALASSIQRVDGRTGTVLAPLVASGSSRLLTGQGLLVDGRTLLVSDGARNAVLAFDVVTGEPLEDVVAAGAGGLSNPHGLALDADGHLLVTSRGDHSVKRYDRSTGEYLGDAVPPRAGGLDQPTAVLVVQGPRLRRATDRVLQTHSPEGVLPRH